VLAIINWQQTIIGHTYCEICKFEKFGTWTIRVCGRLIERRTQMAQDRYSWKSYTDWCNEF